MSKILMEDLICTAYTYIEFDKSFLKYKNNNRNLGYTEEDLKSNWVEVIAAYSTVSEYMADGSIKQAQALVMGEF